jgi:hypothetical protein
MSNKGICKATAVLFVMAMVTCCIPAVNAGDWYQIWEEPTGTVVVGVNRGAPKPWEDQVYATELSTGDIYKMFIKEFYTGVEWTKIGGPGKMFVTAGLDGTLYGRSVDWSGVYRHDYAEEWTQIGSAEEIYGGVYGLFGTNPDTGDIYSYDEAANTWTKIGGPGKMFAVGFDGIYRLAPDGMSVEGYGEGKFWANISGPIHGGAIEKIYIGGAGDELYATSADTGDIYHHTCEYITVPGMFIPGVGQMPDTTRYLCTWTKIGGPGKMFAVNQAGNLYGLNTAGGIYQYDGTPEQWTNIGAGFDAIYAGGLYGLYATKSTTNDLWYYDTGVAFGP